MKEGSKKEERLDIQKAIKRPGALRKTAQRKGLLEGKNDKLTKSDLDKLERFARKHGDSRLLKQVNLARTLSKLRKKKK